MSAGRGTTAVLVETRPKRSMEAEDRCPSCDTEAAWQVSRRHRFSPFGSVLLLVFAFWTAVAGLLLGIGYTPAAVLLAATLATGIATRKAEVCGACGYVRPQGR